MPLAATTYYFASKDELVGEALAILVEDEITRVAERAAALGEDISSPSRSAAAVAEVLFPDAEAAGGLLAKFEVYLEAARRPGLRATAAHWQASSPQLAEAALPLAGRVGPEAARAAPGRRRWTGCSSTASPRASTTSRSAPARQLEQLFELVLAAA